MRFIWTQELPSTQIFLSDYVRQNGLNEPFVVATRMQTEGIGSRANTWESVSCGLYLSCGIHKDSLPQDLPKQSISIYFGQILLEIFQEFHDSLWLKWPNDFYIRDHKVGGIMTQSIRDCVVFGVGLNIASTTQHALMSVSPKSIPKDSQIRQESAHENESWQILCAIIQKILHFLSLNVVKLDLRKNHDIHVNSTHQAFLQEARTWHKAREQYKKDFYKNHRFHTHIQQDNMTKKVSLRHAQLQDDGSIALCGTILYSSR